MGIQRHTTAWYMALDAYVRERESMPFEWGSNDCCTFAADWVRIARGTDPMADLRGMFGAGSKLARAHGACTWLASNGGLLAAVTARMGHPIDGRLAQVGDVALVRHDGTRLSMGVCMGAHVAAPGLCGLLMVPILQGQLAWRV